ncbi:MAG: class II D-tagatose-bisphosphate aldolase, non-catalytic subunit [Desulfurococcaceae archaeon]
MTDRARFFEKLLRYMHKRSFTFLGISPVSEYVIISGIKAVAELNAPLIFVVSLNQVDIDGGYTGFTPNTFVKYVQELAIREHLDEQIILFQLDHCGPWLKDEHILRNYSYNEALEATLKSLEKFIKAGFTLIHIDTTIDLEKTNYIADVELAAKRTVEIISYAENIARDLGVKIYYEVGSDRWGFRTPDVFARLISNIISGLKGENIDHEKVIFVVTDVGTRVRPGNRVDEKTISLFSNIALHHGYLLKIHSGDYLENPSILPLYRVGGINIGPMFADIQFKLVKEATLMINRNDLLDRLYAIILKGDKLKKHTKKDKIEEHELGLASRYIWSSPEAREVIKIVEQHGISLARKIIEEIKNTIEWYMRELNLTTIEL